MDSNTKEVERQNYKKIIRETVQGLTKNTYIEKAKIIRGLIISSAMSCFLAWCSAGSDNNFSKLLSQNKVFHTILCLSPVIICVIYNIAILNFAKKGIKEINLKSEMTDIFWKKMLYRYILKKLGYEEFEGLYEIKKVNKILEETKGHADIVINTNDFAIYLETYYRKYQLEVYYDFYKDLANYILLDNESKSSLISTGDDYTFIVKDNPELLNVIMLASL